MYVRFVRKDLLQLFNGRTNAFNEFIDNLVFSESYIGRKALIEATNNYDMFVLGSDQVWNPMNYGADFFSMTFIPDEKKKIAYAPSFGVSQIPIYQKKGTVHYLNRIEHISVREVSGKVLIKELTGREAKLVVDPTILLERKYWDELKGKRIIEEPYIMCYFLGSNPNHRDYANRLKNETKLKIVSLPHMDQIVDADNGFGDIVPQNIGPIEFINLISNAEYVCTDSFHGTVFSILYHRNFFTFDRYVGGADSTNSRLNSILEICGLLERKIDSAQEINYELLSNTQFNELDEKIEYLRKESLEFLTKALES